MSDEHVENLKQHFINQRRPWSHKMAALIDEHRDIIDPDAPKNISVGEMDQAMARLADAKAKRAAGEMDVAEFKTIKGEVHKLRQLWKLQENAAGRRSLDTRVEGDAVQTGG